MQGAKSHALFLQIRPHYAEGAVEHNIISGRLQWQGGADTIPDADSVRMRDQNTRARHAGPRRLSSAKATNTCAGPIVHTNAHCATLFAVLTCVEAQAEAVC